MKTSLLLLALTLLTLDSGFAAQAQKKSQTNVAQDVDTLGGNEDLMKKAQSLRSQTRARIVQDRIVSRRNRLEFGLAYGGVIGGNSYLQTQSLDVNTHYHITPRWSVGIQYSDFQNNLSPEGKRVFSQYRAQQAAGGLPAYAIDVDYPLHATQAFVHWYPIYGKTSFMDMGVSQFDLYLMAGGGQITLSSGSTSIYSVGAGIGAWLTQNLSLRAEIKYQSYQDQPITGSRDLSTGSATVGMGWIL